MTRHEDTMDGGEVYIAAIEPGKELITHITHHAHTAVQVLCAGIKIQS